jgi:hypothetical protein
VGGTKAHSPHPSSPSAFRTQDINNAPSLRKSLVTSSDYFQKGHLEKETDVWAQSDTDELLLENIFFKMIRINRRKRKIFSSIESKNICFKLYMRPIRLHEVVLN